MPARYWRTTASLLLLTAALLLLTSCQQPFQPTLHVHGSGLDITHLTTGTIDANTLIAVRYRDEQVSEQMCGQELSVDVFSFSPEIRGRTYWRDTRTLVFEPEQPLYRQAKYHAVLDHARLLPEEKRASAAPVEFEFETLGQQLVTLRGSFLPADPDRPQWVQFHGTLQFAEALTPEMLRRALRLTLDGMPLEYTLATDNSRSFQLRSAELERYHHAPREVAVSIDGAALQLVDSRVDQFTLPALDAPLTVLAVEEEKVAEFSQLRITFSDQLKGEKDYAGYMSIVPTMKYAVKVEGSSLVVTGEFKPGEKYRIRLFPGIEGAAGQTLAQQADLMWDVRISDRIPAVEFVNAGMYLTSSSNQRIAFRSMNVERIRLQVKRVPEANLIEFFEENSFLPQSSSFTSYNRYGFQRFGEILVDTIVEVGREMNKWVYSELDLGEVLAELGGLYIVQLSFDEGQALYFPEDLEYWEISSHTAARGRAVKHILVSNIGITAKEIQENLYVFLTDLLTTELIPGAAVTLKDGRDRVIDEAETNESGWALLQTTSEARYIEVHTEREFAILSLSSSQLSNSLFDIGGVQSQGGIDAFIYTERGVYRPGDNIHLAAIVRNTDHTFPADHPLTLSLYNPQGRLVHEKVLTSAEDGFYSTTLSTEPSAPTGTWQAVLDIAGRHFSHDIRVETIVPYRIRVSIASSREQIELGDEEIDISIASEYLFGAPASGLKHETTVILEPVDVSFARYEGFVFGNESIYLPRTEVAALADALDDSGEYHFSVTVPKLEGVPGALRLRTDTKVYESGGRFVPAVKLIPVETYPSYVGIKSEGDPDKGMGDIAGFQIVHVTSDGEPIPNAQLVYTIYRHRYSWWWEYDSEASFRRHYKTSTETAVIETGTITTSAEGVAFLQHRLSDYGEILLEVKDPIGGHTAGYFFTAYWFGAGAEPRSADIVNLKLDKESYYPGETAVVTLNTPARGRALVTVEKGGSILYQDWAELTSTESSFAIPVEEEFIPNAYVSVMVYQPFDKKDNDLPLRMYGVVPLHVESVGTRFEFQVSVPESVRPEEEFTVAVQTSDRLPAQFTLAVVDEGILDITGFETPQPWEHFFAKQRLLTTTYDNLSHIIDLYYGYLHNTLSVGGGTEAEYRERRTGADDTRRFEPVSIFFGPITTNEAGYAEVRVRVPNYLGSLRVMAVGANRNRYGSGDEAVAVKSPVMVLPTLPRVLGPEDHILVPVTVFALEEELGEVEVTLSAQGPVEVVGPDRHTISFSEAESRDVFFELRAQEAIGTAQISVSAYAPAVDYRSVSDTELAVRPDNPVIYSSSEKIVSPGKAAVFLAPDPGLPGTDRLQLTVSSYRGLNINHRIKWLIRYPYGCLEQVTSAVFPQLYLAEVYSFSLDELAEMDKNINAAIQAFREYQLSDGGFSYWPNQSWANAWATNYVGHFLLEAQRKGYHVPGNMLEMWTQYQTQAAKDNLGDTLTRAYRLYLLALAGSPQLSAMNYMRESELASLSNPAKYLLAGAYYLAGYTNIPSSIIAAASLEVPDYYEFGNTFGSTVRDQAIMLATLTLLGDYAQGAQLYDAIAQELSSNRWYSTQTTAYSLMALTKYISAVKDTSPTITGRLTYEGNEEELEVSDIAAVIPLPTDTRLFLFENTSEIPLFATLEWEGIPKRGDIRPEQQGLTLQTLYANEDGMIIDVSRVHQGETFYIIFRVGQEGYETIDEVALMQILPSGWEIENLRLSGGELPEWADLLNLGFEDYVDIRDDRIMWFFTKEPYYMQDFVVKVNAVTVGQFYLPPTLLEAMYNNDYKVTTAGQLVEVLPR